MYNENELATRHPKQNELATPPHIQNLAWKLFCKALKTNESFFTHPENSLYSGNIESDTPKGKRMYRLTHNGTNRALPETVTSPRIMQLPKRKQGESIGFDNGGDTALILNADGKTLAKYEYQERVFSREAYLNG
jgi:hypothetical protein